MAFRYNSRACATLADLDQLTLVREGRVKVRERKANNGFSRIDGISKITAQVHQKTRQGG